MTDTQLRQQFLATRLARLRIKIWSGLENGEDIFLYREATKDGRLLWQVANPRLRASVHGLCREVLLIQRNTTCIRRDEADDHVKGGGLACAVGAEQAYDFT